MNIVFNTSILPDNRIQIINLYNNYVSIHRQVDFFLHLKMTRVAIWQQQRSIKLKKKKIDGAHNLLGNYNNILCTVFFPHLNMHDACIESE